MMVAEDGRLVQPKEYISQVTLTGWELQLDSTPENLEKRVPKGQSGISVNLSGKRTEYCYIGFLNAIKGTFAVFL